MIEYDNGGVNRFLGLLRVRGSVLPFAFLVALPVSVVGFCVKLYEGALQLSPDGSEFLTDNSVWSGFTVLVGFLIIFRTSEAYSRYWQGATSAYLMRAEWFDACSSLIAFCRHSKNAEPKRLQEFRDLLIRLFSVLHTCALADLEATFKEDPDSVNAYRFDVIDVQGLDVSSIDAIRITPNKVELVFTWIQMAIVDAVADGLLTIPPPLLTRSFQEMANGMVQFHDALKIRMIPFPFPYAQLCDGMLVLHGMLTPFIVSQWVTSASACMIFCFVTVFTLWSLNGIAVEIENPFGRDENDLDGKMMQSEMNNNLALMAQPSALVVPTLTIQAAPINGWAIREGEARCLWDAWTQLGGTSRAEMRRRASTRCRHGRLDSEPLSNHTGDTHDEPQSPVAPSSYSDLQLHLDALAASSLRADKMGMTSEPDARLHLASGLGASSPRSPAEGRAMKSTPGTGVSQSHVDVANTSASVGEGVPKFPRRNFSDKHPRLGVDNPASNVAEVTPLENGDGKAEVLSQPIVPRSQYSVSTGVAPGGEQYQGHVSHAGPSHLLVKNPSRPPAAGDPDPVHLDGNGHRAPFEMNSARRHRELRT